MGFTDAEGNFQVFPKVRKNKQTGAITSYGIGYHFHMGLHLQDIEILRSIQNMLGGIGKIYEYPLKPEAHNAIYLQGELLWFLENVLLVYPLLTLYQISRFNKVK